MVYKVRFALLPGCVGASDRDRTSVVSCRTLKMARLLFEFGLYANLHR